MVNEKDSSDYVMYFGYEDERKMVALKNIKQSELEDLKRNGVTILSTKNREVDEFLDSNWKSIAHTPVFVMESLGFLFTFPIASLDDIVFYKELTDYNYDDIPNVLTFASDEVAKMIKVLSPKCKKSDHKPSSKHKKTLVECNIEGVSITFTPGNKLNIWIRDNDTGDVMKVPSGETVVLTKDCIINTVNGTIYDKPRYDLIKD